MANYTGQITYAKPTINGDKVDLYVEGTVNLSRSLLEYPATPVWQTVWKIFDIYGKLLWSSTSYHSLMFFNQTDSAVESFNAKGLPKEDNYNLQVLAQLSGDPLKFVAGKTVNIYSVPAPQPAPYVPPVGGPYVPGPEPPATPDYPDLIYPPAPKPAATPDWVWPAAIAGAAIILLVPGKKK